MIRGLGNAGSGRARCAALHARSLLAQKRNRTYCCSTEVAVGHPAPKVRVGPEPRSHDASPWGAYREANCRGESSRRCSDVNLALEIGLPLGGSFKRVIYPPLSQIHPQVRGSSPGRGAKKIDRLVTKVAGLFCFLGTVPSA